MPVNVSLPGTPPKPKHTPAPKLPDPPRFAGKVPDFHPKTFDDSRNMPHHEGNKVLAAEIQALWHGLGHKAVKVWAEEKQVWIPRQKMEGGIPVKSASEKSLVNGFEICSNLVNGIPPVPPTSPPPDSTSGD